MSRSQNETHVGYKDQMHRKSALVGSSINDVGSERGERGTTVRDSDPHSMAVGMKRENKESDTELCKE